MNKKTILFDMDEVLFDLEGTMTEMFYPLIFDHQHPLKVTNDVFFSYLSKFTENGGFEKNKRTEVFGFLENLAKEISMNGHNVAICTSNGNFTNREEVIRQKTLSLKGTYFENVPYIFTNSGKEKSFFANKNTMLIDDHPSNTKAFSTAGGYGYHFLGKTATSSQISLLFDAVHVFLKA